MMDYESIAHSHTQKNMEFLANDFANRLQSTHLNKTREFVDADKIIYIANTEYFHKSVDFSTAAVLKTSQFGNFLGFSNHEKNITYVGKLHDGHNLLLTSEILIPYDARTGNENILDLFKTISNHHKDQKNFVKHTSEKDSITYFTLLFQATKYMT